MRPEDRINLIYIASIGRSGSTLLDCMLGAHSQISTMGEIHLWPHEIRDGGVRPCSCGQFVGKCSFWSEMRRRVDPWLQCGPPLHFFREKHNAGRTLRLDYLRGFFSNKGEGHRQQRMIEQYGRNNEEIFRQFIGLMAEASGRAPQWIVDASKDPYRLLWLCKSNRFNIKVIHLVKNPNAFVYSVTKQWLRSQPSFNVYKRLYYTSRQSGAWIVQNALFSLLAEHVLPSEDYLLLNYETFAAAPFQSFSEVCRTVGCTFEPEAVDRFREGSIHTIAGNPMRYAKGGISLDEKWKTQLPASSKLLTDFLTSTSKSRYGYS